MITTLDTVIEYEDMDYYVEVEVEYYTEIYGDDADGNRGISMTNYDIKDCVIEILDKDDRWVNVTDKMEDILADKIEEYVHDAGFEE